MAGDATALAKPVMGTSVPAPPNRASLLYRFSPVNRADRNTRLTEVAVAASSWGSSISQPFRISCPITQMAPPMAKARAMSFSRGDFFCRFFT